MSEVGIMVMVAAPSEAGLATCEECSWRDARVNLVNGHGNLAAMRTILLRHEASRVLSLSRKRFNLTLEMCMIPVARRSLSHIIRDSD
jgi:hypothetical protein